MLNRKAKYICDEKDDQDAIYLWQEYNVVSSIGPIGLAGIASLSLS